MKKIIYLIIFLVTNINLNASNQKSVEEFLVKQLNSLDKSSKVYILDQIKNIKLPIFIPELKKLVNDKDVGIRIKSAYLLAKVYNDFSFVNVLIEVLNTKPKVDNPETPVGRARLLMRNQFRAEAVKLLGDIGDEKYVSVISKATTDSEGIVADSAYFALALMAQNKKIKPLPEITEFFYSGLKHSDAKVRLKAVKILGELKDKTSVSPLVLRLKDHDKTVRAAAVISLGLIGDSSVFQDIAYLKSDKEDAVRSALAESLGYLGESLKGSTETIKIVQLNKIKDLLMELMNDFNGGVRINAAVSLWKLGEVTGMGIIKKGLTSDDLDVKIFCIESVGNYGTREDIKLIENFIQDENIFIRTVTNVSLLKIYLRK
ncbi:MAG: HEAT repeat domain-containing protein [Endomicrobiia bacterium]